MNLFFFFLKKSKRAEPGRPLTYMEGVKSMSTDEGQYRNWPAPSPEIVEIGEESKSIVTSRDVGANDVYVAVGKNDLHLVKWALDHAISPGSRVVLVHVFAPLTYIPTPVGRLSRSQLSKDQVQVYIKEESNRRKHLLQKYINICNESRIPVDTMLVESSASAKAILDLISVANITHLVVGTKQSPFTRLARKGLGKGEYIQKKAPEFCEVTVVYDGKKTDGQRKVHEARRPQITRHSERNFFECVCFSGKFE
ncbi:U-box domain-containing protein 52-like [Primulina tabacum]|uniref:U-box domain-containing protein 52-like n=1 Tax=Primulina tabacum TaxID=48773 RepID=UPI003F590A33